jgi:two-component system LytT family response regulator
MERIRTLIVDDEPLARECIRLLIKDDPDIEIVGESGTGQDAETMIHAEAPDLMFLDVQMPEMSGFDVLARFGPGQAPAVIFVTAYDEYALKAFEVHALDYLLKPFTDDRFLVAVTRAKAYVEAGRVEEVNKRLTALVESYQEQQQRAGDGRSATRQYRDRLMVKSGGRVLFLDVREIDWVEAADYYVQLHTGTKTVLLRETLGNLESQLDPALFLRIHRSTLVNLERVREVKPHRHGNYQMILRDGTVLELSRRRRDRFHSVLDRFS